MGTAAHADIFAPPGAAADGRIELIGLDRAELADELARIGAPAFRARKSFASVVIAAKSVAPRW